MPPHRQSNNAPSTHTPWGFRNSKVFHVAICIVEDIDGKDVSLSKFKGRPLLIVNVASQCGLTTANYTELSHLYEKYKAQGFEILAFPCNQFGAQEPGSNPQIKQFACTRFKAEFPIFDKVDVNGPNTAPIYKFLKSSAGGFLGDLVKWNFEKFLVDKNGKVVERYPPTTSPFQIENPDSLRLSMDFALAILPVCLNGVPETQMAVANDG
uniref:Glutathione peroxidase n=1 Tax=Oryza brachyantha TaxID=4533 RepID=J3MBX2_ORYBR